MLALPLAVPPGEDHAFGGQIRVGCVPGVEPYGLGVVRIAAPRSRMIMGAAEELGSDHAGDFGVSHLDSWSAVCSEMLIQPFVLLASDHAPIVGDRRTCG